MGIVQVGYENGNANRKHASCHIEPFSSVDTGKT